MKNRSFITALATFLTITIVAPAMFFVVPQRAHAIFGVGDIVSDIPAEIWTGLGYVESAIGTMADVAQQASVYALVLNKYVLEPLAFVVSGNAIKSITGGVIKFINGDTNGTGQSQFVQNLQGHTQGIGDSQANAFFFQFGRNSNSPFARSINSSLRTNYYQQTSLAGFFAANRNTLPQYSQDQNAYLAGNWSQGGAGAWFALTTQDQNNPYMLHARAQTELYRMVQDKTASRLQELAWGGGILSWCGGDAAKNADALAPGTAGSTQEGPIDPSKLAPGTEGSTQEGPPAPTGTKTPVAPGDPCTNSDGTPGTIQTPGSAISGYLDKTLGLNADKFTAMGNAAGQINSILGSMANVMQTAGFATEIIGGASVNGITGGLAGASDLGSNGRSYIDQYQDSPGYLGVTQTGINNDALTNPALSGQNVSANVDRYESAWNIIGGATSAASINVTSVINSCTSTIDSAKVSDAENALINKVNPVLANVAAASTTIASARAVIQRVKGGQSSGPGGPGGAGGSFSADLQALQAMPPTTKDTATAEKEAVTTSSSFASPEGSLSVSGGTTVDQMNLISANALALKNSCIGISTATSTTP